MVPSIGRQRIRSTTAREQRVAIGNRKTQLADLAALFKDPDAILKERMDKLVNNFKADNPDFVADYFKNRIIIDPATTSTKIKGIVTDKATEKTIKGATVTANGIAGTGGAGTPDPGGVTVSAKTSAKGTYTLKPLPPGDYDITVTAPGYTDVTEPDIHATLGTNNHLDVDMEGI